MNTLFKITIILTLTLNLFGTELSKNTLSTNSLFDKKNRPLYHLLSALYQKKIYPIVNSQTLPLFSTEKQVLNYVLSNTLLDNKRDLLWVLENRLKAANNIITGNEAWQAISLYNAIFAKTCSAEKLSSPAKMVILRGGRGAGPFTKLLKTIRYTNGETSKQLVSLNVLLGATDDGRSWHQAGKELDFTGIPDIGKSILDMSLNPSLTKLLSFRFAKNEVKDAILKRNPMSFKSWKGYRYISSERPKSTKHLTSIRDAINKNKLFCNFMQHPRPYTFQDERDIKFMQAVFELINKSSDIKDVSTFLNKAHEEFILEQKTLLEEIKDKEFLTDLFKKLKISEDLTKKQINNLADLLKSFLLIINNYANITNSPIDFQLHEIPLRSIFVLGAYFIFADWQKAIDHVSSLLELEDGNRVLPATTERHHLIGLLSDGTFFSTEDDINEVKKTAPFEHLYLTNEAPSSEQIKLINSLATIREKKNYIENNLQSPDINANPEALKAIEEADIVVYMPTTLESNIGSALIVPEIGKAITSTKAVKIVIPNAIIDNDLKNTTVYDYLNRITRYATNKPLSSGELTYSDYQSSVNYSIGRSEGLLDPIFKQLMKNNFKKIRKNMGIPAFGIGDLGKLDEETPENFGMYHENNIVDLLLTITGIEQAGFKFDSQGNLKAKNPKGLKTSSSGDKMKISA